VRVDIVTPAELDLEFPLLLQEWFQLNSVAADIRRSPALNPREVLTRAPDENLLRIWVTFGRTDQARVYFVEPSGHRVLLREVSLRARFDEIAREQLAQVIVTSASAFMERRASSSIEDFKRALQDSSGTRTAREPEKHPEPERLEQPAVPRLALRIGALYQLQLQRGSTAMHGPGIVLGVAHRTLQRRWLTGIKAQYAWSRTVELPEVNLGLDAFAMRASFGVEQRVSSHLEAGVEFGAGADRVSFSPARGRDTTVQPTAAASAWRPAVMADARASLVSAPVRLTLLLGTSAYFRRSEYAVLRAGVVQVVYSSFPLEPHIALEATWE
jgi:hypothetical protein